MMLYDPIPDGTGDPADLWQSRVMVQSNEADQRAGTLTRRGILLERVWAALAAQDDGELYDGLTLLAYALDDWLLVLIDRQRREAVDLAVAKVPRGHPPGYGHRGAWHYNEQLLADVGQVACACPRGSRTRYVADWFDVPIRTAERWVHKSRQAGYDIPRW